MQSYRTKVKIEDPKKLVLSNLPFRSGQVVEVLVQAEEYRAKAVSELKALLKQTQALPKIKKLSEEEILAEIEAHRSGR